MSVLLDADVVEKYILVIVLNVVTGSFVKSAWKRAITMNNSDFKRIGYKPLNGKCYGHIAHLRGSKTGPGDHICNIGDQIRATEKVKDKHDRIIVLEKLDGSNVGVAKLEDGYCVALIRAGYVAMSSKYLQHKLFCNWVWDNLHRFNSMLEVGERACGEWLAMAHGTRYKLQHEPLVIFDIMRENTRICNDVLVDRTRKYNFVTPHVIHVGGSLSIKEAIKKLGTYGYHGALDPVEGCVWRIERNEPINKYDNSSPRQWIVKNLVKYVRPDKKDGIYFKDRDEDAIWNYPPDRFKKYT